MNPLGILLIIAGCIALVAALAIGGWLTLGVSILLKRSVYPKRILPQPSDALAEAECSEVEFPSEGDGAMLSGWFIRAKTQIVHGVILCCHGMSQNREQMLEWAETFWGAGFHVLLFDFRALGKSEGERATGGFMEAKDVMGAVAYLAERPDCARLKIGAFGFSMGGSAIILAAAEEPRIRAVATHAAFATLDSAITQRCRFHFGKLGPLVEWGFRQVGRRHFHVQPGDIAPVRVVSCISPRPLLVLHGEKDPIILPHNAHDLFEAAGEPKCLRFLPNGDHEPVLEGHTEEVHAEVVEFFRQALSP